MSEEFNNDYSKPWTPFGTETAEGEGQPTQPWSPQQEGDQQPSQPWTPEGGEQQPEGQGAQAGGEEQPTQPWAPQQEAQTWAPPTGNEGESQPAQSWTPEGAESQDKAPRGSKTSASVKANMRANQMVKKRYKFAQVSIEGMNVYIIEAGSMAFDRILRRTAREVNSRADNYTIPLGTTCTGTIVAAYGLSNGEIYHEEEWLNLLAAYNAEASAENAVKVMQFLRAAAILKYLRVSGKMVNLSDPYEFAAAILQMNEQEIVNYFCNMVR